jgi:hypothetical protein
VRRNHRQTQDLWKGMLAGMAGGLVASWAMNQFQAGVKKISEASQQGQASEQGQNGGQAEEAEDATMKTAEKVSEVVAYRSLTKEQKKQAGPRSFTTRLARWWAQRMEQLPNLSARSLRGGRALWDGVVDWY